MQGVVRQQADSGSGAAAGQAAREDGFRFQISKAVPEHLLVAWLQQAAAGERIEYCEGYVPLREDAAWKLAGAWAREGLVHLVTEKDGARTRWIAEKRGGSRPVAALPDPTAAKIADLQAAKLLALLREAAAAGQRCPTKTAMALEVTGQDGERARNRVTYLRKRLEAEGKIAWEAGSHKAAPVVTILARGKGCGLSTASSSEAVGRQETPKSDQGEER